MARFQSGTLGRSIKRFGRFARGPKVQRVGHSWKYSTLTNSALPIGVTTTDIVLFDSTDWEGITTTAVPVKNVSFDVAIGITWTPLQAAAAVFQSGSIWSAVMVLDRDDTGGTLGAKLAEQRALWWSQHANNWVTWPLANTDDPTPGATNRGLNFRARGKQRFMKFDEELRLLISPQVNLNTVITDARLFVLARLSWETP